MKSAALNILFLLLSFHVLCQDKVWVYFTDKGEKAESGTVQDDSFLDREVYYRYTDSLDQLGFDPEVKSRWLNAVSGFLLSPDQAKIIEALSFVDGLEPVNFQEQSGFATQDSFGYSFALEQVNAQAFVEKGLNGEGIKVGIIDGGFLKADEDFSLVPLMPNQVLGYRDYLSPDAEAYSGSMLQGDDHGTVVWKMISGVDTSRSVRYGLAPAASYYLARTDHGVKETRLEEDYWVAALEWMDSCGVKIVNSSLGYNYGFDDEKENYLPHQMDGKTTVVSKALDIASREKGILVIVAAGNDGDKDWKIISAPADVQNSLAVGATNYEIWNRAKYSSVGPEFLDYVKPDISCFASNGTSFSTPIITGIAACLLQYRPELSNSQIKDLIVKSGHLYPFVNNFIGSGVPDGEVILSLADSSMKETAPRTISVGKKKIILSEEDWEVPHLTLFHKKDSLNVIEEETLFPINGEFVIKKPEKARRTTIAFQREVAELIWE